MAFGIWDWNDTNGTACFMAVILMVRHSWVWVDVDRNSRDVVEVAQVASIPRRRDPKVTLPLVIHILPKGVASSIVCLCLSKEREIVCACVCVCAISKEIS